MKKIIYAIVFSVLLLTASHATFMQMTNMTVVEFFTYLYAKDKPDDKIPVFIPMK